jgi:hypothetical protein
MNLQYKIITFPYNIWLVLYKMTPRDGTCHAAPKQDKKEIFLFLKLRPTIKHFPEENNPRS